MLLRCEKAGDCSEWNKWVTSPESSKTGLQEIKLAGADIHGANLEGAILEGATITKQTFPVLDCPEH
ncbi:MAG TPA: pentapeptide repeat-containing protein [Methanocorpusculum sp.]|nr:pentapeptide repeat-containing protein [Methanocorpusculum sp.]